MKTARNKVYHFLRWSEKYTKTDMLYLAKGGFWVTSGQVITSALSLFLIIVFANLLSKESYGMYRYILSLAGILNIFVLTGMNSSVSRAVAAGNEGVLKISVIHQLKWNLFMLAAFWMLGGYYLINGNDLLATSFFILGIFVPSTLALNTYSAYLEGKKEFRVASIFNVISVFIYVIGILTAIILSGEVIWLVIAYGATAFVTTLFFYIYTLYKFKPPTAVDFKDTLRYARELTLIRLMGPIVSQIDKIILVHFWGPAQLAVYWLAMAVPVRAMAIIKSWVKLGFPKFVTKTPKEINTVFYRRILQGMFIGAVVAILYVLVSPYLFKYLLPQYLDGIIYSQILAISFIFAMPGRYVGLLFESQKLSRQIFINSIINNILALLLYVVLGIWGGILGLVIAHVLKSFIGTLINMIIWRRWSRV